MVPSKILFLTLIVCGFLYGALGHSYVTKPITRGNQKETNVGCRGPNCMGPCEVPLASKTRAAIRVSRGDEITVQWPRNNHAGGFIRFAWAPTGQSDSHAAFDNNVQQINCHEVGGCGPDDRNQPNGGDSGPASGDSRACTSVFTVPPHLADGDWTLQWAWFGGAFALGDYYSCVDYRISGGQSGTFTPVFKGGDFTYPNQQKCKFFNTNQLHKCTNEPCNNPIFSNSQEQAGVPAFIQQNMISVTPVTPVVQTPIIPVVQTPSTTSAPITTSRIQIPAPVPAPVVPAPVVPAPVVPAPVQPTSSSNSQTCAGAIKSSISRAVIPNIDMWNNGRGFRAVVLLWPQEAVLTNWFVEIQWPLGVTVTGAWNAGSLVCQANNRALFKPAAAWANNLNSGSVMTIEVIGESSQSVESAYLIANTKVVVYKQ